MSRLSMGIATAFAIVASAGVAFAAGGMGGETTGGMGSQHQIVYKIIGEGGSGQNGTVTLIPGPNNTTTVRIAITGEPAAAVEPAHIHTGSCPAPGAVKYPLTNVIHGASLTTVNAPIATLGAGLSVNIHQSAAHLNIYKACGNL